MSRRPMRIIFMGTPDFAVPSLQALLKGPDELICVITQPDRPKGRGRKLVPPPVKALATEAELEVLQPDNIRSAEFHNALKSRAPDLIVVAAYGKILPSALLDIPLHGCINVHGSILPRHRGAAPIQWAIIAGDNEVGVTIMQMDKGMDTGDILLIKSITPEEDETAGSLFPKIAELGAQALMDTIDMLADGGLAMISQEPDQATLAPMLKKLDGLIDWSEPADKIERLIRGLDPWPTAYCTIDNLKLQLFLPKVIYQTPSQPPGTILRADPEGLLIATGDQSLLIREVKPEGKKRMSVASFLNGHPLSAGNRIDSLPSEHDKS